MESVFLPLAIMLVLFGSAILINYIRVHFGLRSLFVVMTLAAVLLGVIGYLRNR